MGLGDPAVRRTLTWAVQAPDLATGEANLARLTAQTSSNFRSGSRWTGQR